MEVLPGGPGTKYRVGSAQERCAGLRPITCTKTPTGKCKLLIFTLNGTLGIKVYKKLTSPKGCGFTRASVKTKKKTGQHTGCGGSNDSLSVGEPEGRRGKIRPTGTIWARGDTFVQGRFDSAVFEDNHKSTTSFPFNK